MARDTESYANVVDAMQGRLSGMLPETAAFTAGAEHYARGDWQGAARIWKPFLREPGLFTQALSDALEETFERSEDMRKLLASLH